LSSFISGVIAKSLANEFQDAKPEEAFICAMMYNLGKHLAIVYLPNEVRQINKLISDKQLPEAEAATHVLGAPYEILGEEMVKRWKFPNRICRSMQRLDDEVLPPPTGEFEHLHHLVIFSNALTELASQTLVYEREGKLKELYEQCRGSIKLSEQQLKNLFYKVVVQLNSFSAVDKLDLSSPELVRTALNVAARDVDPATVVVRVREQIERQRNEADLSLFGDNEPLDELAERCLEQVVELDVEEAAETLRATVLHGLFSLGLPPCAEFGTQVLVDADDFVSPESGVDPKAVTVGLGAVTISQEQGRPAISVLTIIVGRVPEAVHASAAEIAEWTALAEAAAAAEAAAEEAAGPDAADDEVEEMSA